MRHTSIEQSHLAEAPHLVHERRVLMGDDTELPLHPAGFVVHPDLHPVELLLKEAVLVLLQGVRE